jgi:hypothetical protein
LQLSIP